MCFEFFYVLFFSHFLMNLDFRFASYGRIYERKESSKYFLNKRKFCTARPRLPQPLSESGYLSKKRY